MHAAAEQSGPITAKRGVKMSHSTIYSGWKSYRETVLPRDAGQVQIDETRRAFYAGALIILQAAYQLGEEGLTDEEGVARIDALWQELNAFRATIGTDQEGTAPPESSTH
jgi:hypothetical protein